MKCTLTFLGRESAGLADAGNILKPYLARSGVKFIGSTTNEECYDQTMAIRFTYKH